MSLTPLRRVKFMNLDFRDEVWKRTPKSIQQLFVSRLIGKLEVIDLRQCDLSSEDMLLFRTYPGLPRLKELVLSGNSFGRDGALAIAGMSQLKELESLDLVSNQIDDVGARAIAQSPYLGKLKELRITRNPIRSKRSWTLLELRFGSALL
jgi:Leucine-rich repeat (LRR) protein